MTHFVSPKWGSTRLKTRKHHFGEKKARAVSAGMCTKKAYRSRDTWNCFCSDGKPCAVPRSRMLWDEDSHRQAAWNQKRPDVHKIVLSIQLRSPPQKKCEFWGFSTDLNSFSSFWALFRGGGGKNQILRTRILWTPRRFWWKLAWGGFSGHVFTNVLRSTQLWDLSYKQIPAAFCEICGSQMLSCFGKRLREPGSYVLRDTLEPRQSKAQGLDRQLNN